MADRANVFDLHGRAHGTTDDPEGLFLHHVQLLFHREPAIYVVCGGGTPAGFYAGLDEIGVPYVDDDRIGDRVLIMEGSPLEWEQIAMGAEPIDVGPSEAA